MWIDWNRVNELNEKLREVNKPENQVKTVNKYLKSKWLPEMYECVEGIPIMRDIQEVLDCIDNWMYSVN